MFEDTTMMSRPDGIDWGNFNGISSNETIIGVAASVAINFQISAVNVTGAPVLEYRKNHGLWVSFTTSTPANFNIFQGDSLELQVKGTNGHSATFTVTNISDGNAVIDTVTGTVNDPCDGTPSLGTKCVGGTLYAGQFDGGKYMITPSGCTDSATPECAGGTDSLGKKLARLFR